MRVYDLSAVLYLLIPCVTTQRLPWAMPPATMRHPRLHSPRFREVSLEIPRVIQQRMDQPRIVGTRDNLSTQVYLTASKCG